MSQIKIYGLQTHLRQIQAQLSCAIHQALVESLQYPTDKKFQRFIGLSSADFIYPADRSAQYTIIEISMFSGRQPETKRALIQMLIEQIHQRCGIALNDIEITLYEVPQENWGIRGQHAPDLRLNYQVKV